MANPRFLTLWGLLGCALSWVGCQSAPLEQHVTSVPGLKAELIAVCPFSFRWPEPAYRSFELSHHLVELGLARDGERVLFLGPSEFQVLRPDDDRVFASTDILTVLPSLRVPPSGALVARPWAEKLEASLQGDVSSASGRRVGTSAAEELTYRGHLELLHPHSGIKLLELVADARVDPLAPKGDDDADPAPDLTRLMDSLWAQALTAIEPHLERPFAPHPLPYTFFFVPQAALEYRDATRGPLTAELAQKDPLEGEVLRLARIRYANAGISDAEAARLLSLPGGLYVRATEAAARLRPGDLITQVDGRAALPEALQRARFARGPVALRVRRADGDWMELSYP